VAKFAFGAFWFDQPLTLLLLGLLLASGEEARTLQRAPRAARWRAPLAIAGIGAIMLAWQSLDLLQRSREIGTARARVATAGALTTLPPAHGLPYAVRQDLRLLTAQLLLDSLEAQARLPTTVELKHAIEALEDFARDAPLDCRGPLLASILLETARMPGRAEQARARARLLAPSHPAILRHDRRMAQR
jgi:hypothetical protein